MTRDYTARPSRFVQKRVLFVSLFLPVILLLMPFRTLATNQTPLTYFEVYYRNLLEFSTCSTMSLNGIVYCNSNIDVGAGEGATLFFNSTVASAGIIMAPANNGQSWGNPTNYSSSWNTVFSGNPSNLMNLPPLQLSVPMTNYHDLIDIPATNDPTTPVGRQLLYNQAQVILIVSNTPTSFSNSLIYLKVQKAPTALDVPGSDPTPIIVVYTNAFPASQSTNLPFLSLTNLFYDIREKTTNFVTQIDVGKYKTWLTNSLGPVVGKSFGSDAYPTILYVADYRRTNNLHQLMVVRLVNGIVPPANGGLGFSVATPNPLYILGNYNCTNAALLSTTNTSSAVPSAFYCDAFTVLSSAWSDVNSLHNAFGSGSGWLANDTTINAAVVAGIVPSTGTDNLHFSGGVHNLPRLLEDWSGNVLWLNTSLINLYNSTRATGQFVNPGANAYYVPPTRKFNYDGRYSNPNIMPPGMPTVSTGIPLVFVQPQIGVVPAGNSAHFSFGAAGYGPLTYQWSLNGTNLDGVTNTSFSLTNIQARDAGTYTVTVTDGTSTSTNLVADFTVMDIKPFIHPPPADQVALAGSNVTFTALATGTTPISWQWQFNSTNIDGATNVALVLTNVTADQAGVYTVTVTNLIGSSLSSAVLSVYTSAVPTMDSFSLSASNQVQFTVDGVPGFSYAVQSSTDLVNWDSIITVISPFDFTDTNTANLPQCYYRLIYAP